MDDNDKRIHELLGELIPLLRPLQERSLTLKRRKASLRSAYRDIVTHMESIYHGQPRVEADDYTDVDEKTGKPINLKGGRDGKA